MAIAAPFPAARRCSTTRQAPRTAPVRPVRFTPGQAGGGLRLTARGRSVLGVTSALFLLLIVMLSGRLSADAGTSLGDQGRATGVVVVQPGESLWQIAQAIAPQADPRATVMAIRALNGLGDSTVVAGQSIVIPATGTPGA